MPWGPGKCDRHSGQAKRSELQRHDSLHVGGPFNVWLNHTVRELRNPR